ncbi:MAG: PaaI family thioesterase [Parvibaculum sp.]
MSEDRVKTLNEFTANKHPGHVGVSLTYCEADRVEGRLTVSEPVVAGTGFLWAPVVITLADWLCAAGMSPNLREGESFTTVELKTNFLGSAKVGEVVSGVARPAHRGRTTHVWDVEVKNEATGKIIALFRCTQMILQPR